MILGHGVEGGRRAFASGAPATRGARNSETLMQQPDHQYLVRESIPSRIAEAPSVDAFCRSLSRSNAFHIGDVAMIDHGYLTEVNEHSNPAPANARSNDSDVPGTHETNETRPVDR
jgi:hypothetical protein